MHESAVAHVMLYIAIGNFNLEPYLRIIIKTANRTGQRQMTAAESCIECTQ